MVMVDSEGVTVMTDSEPLCTVPVELGFMG